MHTNTATIAQIYLILVILVFSASGFANDKAKAKTKFKEGVSLFKKEKYKEAIAAYETAYSLESKPVILSNIANCHQALFNYGEAIEMYKRFLDEAGKKAKPRMKKKAKSSIKKLLALVGTLKLTAPPQGADVYIETEKIGNAPLTKPIYLNPGQYSVKVTLDGYQPLETQITVAAGAEITVKADLKREEEQLPPVAPKTTEEKPKLEKDSEPVPVTIVDTENKPRVSGLLIGSLVTGGLGLAGFGVGIYFTKRQNDHVDELDSARDAFESNPNEETHAAYAKKYDEIEGTEAPVDQRGMTIGYVAGGILLTTGIAFFILDQAKKRDKEDKKESITMRPAPSGLALTF